VSLEVGGLPPTPCPGHPACDGSTHSGPGSPVSSSHPAPCRRAAKLPRCDRSHAASTVSKSPAAQMCALLSRVRLRDQHPPASRCSGERPGEAPWDGWAGDPSHLAVGSRGSCVFSSHLGTHSAGRRSARCHSWLSQHPQASSTALQEKQAARRWQHLSQGDNKSYQCKPIRRQQDNPRDNPADTEASSALCQRCGFTDKCHGWRDCVCAGTCRLPRGGPPLLPTPALWLWALLGPGRG